MSIFWGVNFPPPQKYTSLERVVTTAIGVSVTVLSLCCNQDNTSVTHYKTAQGSSKRRMWSKETTYFGFLIAEFSRATRSSSSLPQNDAVSGSSEFITSNRNWNTFLIRKFQKPFSLNQHTVCHWRWPAGPESARLWACWQDPAAQKDCGNFAEIFLIVSGMNPFVSYQPPTILLSDHSPDSPDQGIHTPVWSMQANKHLSSLPSSSCPGLFSHRGSEGSYGHKGQNEFILKQIRWTFLITDNKSDYLTNLPLHQMFLWELRLQKVHNPWPRCLIWSCTLLLGTVLVTCNMECPHTGFTEEKVQKEDH